MQFCYYFNPTWHRAGHSYASPERAPCAESALSHTLRKPYQLTSPYLFFVIIKLILEYITYVILTVIIVAIIEYHKNALSFFKDSCKYKKHDIKM